MKLGGQILLVVGIFLFGLVARSQWLSIRVSASEPEQLFALGGVLPPPSVPLIDLLSAAPSRTPTPAPMATRLPSPTATATLSPAPLPPTSTPTTTPPPPPTPVLLATATLLAPSPTPRSSFPVGRNPSAPLGANVVCEERGGEQLCAWVSAASPAVYQPIYIFGRLYSRGQPEAGMPMTSTYFWPGEVGRCRGLTRANGSAYCVLYAPAGARGSRLLIHVTIGGLAVTTWIYPR